MIELIKEIFEEKKELTYNELENRINHLLRVDNLEENSELSIRLEEWKSVNKEVDKFNFNTVEDIWNMKEL